MNGFWNETTLELLVEHVECYPELWDKRYEKPNQKDISAKRWNTIGKLLGCPGKEASRQFKLLQKRFSRYLERLGNDSSRNVRPFFLAEKMLFLLVPDVFEYSLPDSDTFEESIPQTDMSNIYEEFLDSSEDTCSSTQLTEISERSAESSENLRSSKNTKTKQNNKIQNRKQCRKPKKNLKKN